MVRYYYNPQRRIRGKEKVRVSMGAGDIVHTYKGISKTVICKERAEETEGGSHKNIWSQSYPVRGNCKSKGPWGLLARLRRLALSELREWRMTATTSVSEISSVFI